MPDEHDPKLGKGAITYQSLLQYILIALVGLLSYFQYETSKSTDRVWDQLKEEKSDAKENAKEARQDRKAVWEIVVSNTAQMKQVLTELADARKEQSGIKADVARVQAASEKAAVTAAELKKSVEGKEP